MNAAGRRLGASGAQRGVSLIEALVALAIMAVGMLGIVGVQSTLRSTSDVAKQRSEATRIAQVEIESWRGFMSLAGGGNAYDALPVGIQTLPTVSSPLFNATYTPTRNVTLLPTLPLTFSPAPRRGKALSVTVAWEDRTGETQRVQLSTVIAGIAPELAQTLKVPGGGDQLQRPMGRARGIPMAAKELGGGKSGWIPPGSPTGTAWVFNNVTGLVTLCTTTAATTGLLVFDPVNPSNGNVTCGTGVAIYIGGLLRYALDPAQPTSANALNPPSAPSNFPASNSVTVEARYVQLSTTFTEPCYVEQGPASSPSYTAYSCAVPVLPAVFPALYPVWSGTIGFGPSALISTSGSDTSDLRMKVCRYHTAASYTAQREPLGNQNFLFIRSGDGASTNPVAYTCPSTTPLHQPPT